MVRESSDSEPFSARPSAVGLAGRCGSTRLETPQRREEALGFKIMSDPFVGTLTFARVYSGVIEKGSTVLNSVKGKKARARCEDGKPPGDHAPSQSVRPPCLRSGSAACSK